MSELIGTYRSDIQICSCGSHVFKLLKENGGYTTECRCGFACGPWCEDADSAIQQLINQAKESFQPGYIEVKEGICEDEDIFPTISQNMEKKIIRHDIMAPCCKNYSAILVQEASGRTMVHCKCGKIKTDFYDDASDAFSKYTEMLSEAIDEEVIDISLAFENFVRVRKKIDSLGATLSDEVIAQLLLTEELSRIAESMETTGEFGDNVCRIVNNLDAINRTIAMQ